MQALYDGLKDVNEEQWKDVVDLQKNWIGECTGVRWQLTLEVSTLTSVNNFLTLRYYELTRRAVQFDW